ncbi:tyrosine-protein phosphatase [Dyadobacter psychrotolerans]|uniref:protein-tyrosine-phosphatase n=1 Tax=Dyadobacter psychrotolerans TaxID=2541721 RepID=A0A4R5D4Z2_9BACT|nr:CpsB/CapC family capsule biosynthesis tyrosine phosphatase [Dyadobacter psychrotolerans]TDE08396.1 histidinol phosphatase [Dyadobacter psychrotolerans]
MLNWLFNKKNSDNVSLSRIGVDIHSHIIPGIDDGVETIEQSVAMARKFQELGYTRIVTTPHVMWDCYKNTPEIINAGLEDVRQAVKAAGLNVQIDAAAEYFIDEHFTTLLENGEEFMTLPGKRLLVELPYSTPLLNVSETLFLILQKGYQPVLAHPERYTYFYSDPSIYKKFCDQGCELQVNILSLGSYYNENVHKMAEYLLKNGLITFLGTDAHRMQHLEMIRKFQGNKWLEKYPFQNEKLINI